MWEKAKEQSEGVKRYRSSVSVKRWDGTVHEGPSERVWLAIERDL